MSCPEAQTGGNGPAAETRLNRRELAARVAAAAGLGFRPEDGEKLLCRAERLGWRVLTRGEPAYPPLLARITSAPPVLYVRGRLAEEDEPCVAVVGTRRASAYGLFHAERLALELSAEGFTVVSGLARGIDAAAHRGALAGGGRTLAVLGSGPDRVYPPEHRRLAEEIAVRGALMTEFPPGTPPVRSNFPRRNRIIAGLARATVVVEAGLGSGALNTADHAVKAQRVVCAVPGDVGRPGSAGILHLLREGAIAVATGRQVREAAGSLGDPSLLFDTEWTLGPVRGNDRWLASDNEREVAAAETLSQRGEALRQALRLGPARPEEVARRSGLSISEVAAQLVLWELEGKVQSHPDGRVALSPGRR